MWELDQLSKLPFIGDILKALVQPIMEVYPAPTSFFVGALLGWFGFKSLTESLYSHAFEEFDDDTLTRIRAPTPFDPLRGAICDRTDVVLPWCLPSDGARRDIWKGVLSLATEGVGYKKSRRIPFWRHFSTPETPFGWTILMGESGSGKSRLAVEAARHLARRDLYGGATRVLHRSSLLRLRTWWRVQFRHMRCGGDDHWDAGWLWAGANPGDDGAYPTWVARRGLSELWSERIKAWKPRRPTFLLLDDPLLNDAKKAVETLEAASKHFRHPVRLLIVNQTAPFELGLTKPTEHWTTIGELNPLVQPLVINDKCRFTEQDIRTLRAKDLFAGRFPLHNDEEIRKFLAKTRGNPLLVEVGVKWLRDGKALNDITEAALLTDRVDRIVNALIEAGLSETSHHRAIAVATLAAASDSFARRDLVVVDYPLPIVEPRELKRIFPIDIADLRDFLPPVRPEMFGDAFVRRVVIHASESEREKLFATAWRVNARGMLRSALRLGRRPDDPLAIALSAGPPDTIALDPLDLALAYSESAALIPRTEWESDQYDFGLLHEPLANKRIEKVDAAKAFTYAQRFLATVDASRSTHVERSEMVSRFIATSIVHAEKAIEPPAANDVVQLFARWSDAAGRNEIFQHYFSRYFRDGYTKALDTEFCKVVVGLLQRSLDTEANVFHRVQLWTELSYGFRASPLVCEWIANTIDKMIRRLTGTNELQGRARDLQLLRIRAWCHVAVAFRWKADVADCERAAHQVDKIAEPFKGQPEFELQRARAWHRLTFPVSRQPDAANCTRIAREVDKIAEPFKGQPEFEFQRAEAWRNVAFALTNPPDAANCERAARLVDEIAEPFKGQPDFEIERVEAWSSVAFANLHDAADLHDAANCERTARLVDKLAEPFKGQSEFERQRAETWSAVAFAFANVPDAVSCERTARLVDKIAEPFKGQSEFERQRAEAWRAVAFAFANVPDAANCERTARLVDKLAEPFKGQSEFEGERAKAWSAVAYAFANLHDAANCERTARLVDKLAEPFKGQSEFERQRAEAWRAVAFAFANVPDAVGCERTARLVDKIAEPFKGQSEFERQRAQAWSAVAFAFAKLRDAANCERTARLVDKIAEPFKGQPVFPDFETESRKAWDQVRACT
jgi:hypothetical protein